MTEIVGSAVTNAPASSGGGGIVQGIIAMWSGAANAIPEGWLLCNGQNGTPDLRDRFVIGAGNSYAVSATGGEATHTLTVNEMPKHSHNVPYFGGSSTVSAVSQMASGDQYHYISTDSVGGSQPHNNLPPYYALCYIMYGGGVIRSRITLEELADILHEEVAA